MTSFNHSNHSNHSALSEAGQGSEFDHSGGSSSPLLAAALDMAALALTTPLSERLDAAAMRRPDPSRLYRTMNRRHLGLLVADALIEGIEVRGGDGDVTVTLHGAPLVHLTADRGDAGFWKDQLRKVHDCRWQRGERLAEIVLQQEDLLSAFGMAVPMGPTTHPWTLFLAQAVIEAVIRVEVRVKHLFSIPRPVALAPQIAPVIQTPAHSSFPSGHATEAFALATALGGLFFGDDNTELRLIAARIAVNRTFAGVHFPADNMAGAVLGTGLARVFLHRLLGEAPPAPDHYAAAPGAEDDVIALAYRGESAEGVRDDGAVPCGAPGLLRFVAAEALGEIVGRAVPAGRCQ